MLFVKKKAEDPRPSSPPTAWGNDPNVVDVESVDKPAEAAPDFDKKSLLGGFSAKKKKRTTPPSKTSSRGSSSGTKGIPRSKLLPILVAGGALVIAATSYVIPRMTSAPSTPQAPASPSVPVAPPLAKATGVKIEGMPPLAATSTSKGTESVATVAPSVPAQAQRPEAPPTVVPAGPKLQKLDIPGMLSLASSAWSNGLVVTANSGMDKLAISVNGPKASAAELPAQAGCTVKDSSAGQKTFLCPPLLTSVGLWAGPPGEVPQALGNILASRLPVLESSYDLTALRLSVKKETSSFQTELGTTEGVRATLEGSYSNFPKLAELLSVILNSAPSAVQSVEIGKNKFSAEVILYVKPN
jgi:hypothetical protein